MRTHVILSVLAALLLSACATTALAPVTDPGFTGFEADEAGLWKRAAEQEKALAESGFLYNDSELEEYLNAVARKLEPETVYRTIPFRVRVLKDPHLSAFCLADGAVYLHTGILASIANEAQLATVLGHEMTHAINRDAVRGFRDTNNKAAAFGSLVLLTGGLASVFAPMAGASIAGYSQDVEREADRQGFVLMDRAGYDVTQSVALFEEMKKEIEEEKVTESFFFGSHPKIVERIESYQELIAARKDPKQGGVTNADVFQAHVKKLVLENAQLDMQIGRYERAAGGLKRYVERYPGDARAYYLLGEANRQQGGDEHEKLAVENYQKALSLDAGHAGSHKMLGMIAYKTGDKAAAKEHLEKYLGLQPNAPDHAYIEGYIRACAQAGKQEATRP
ncbi:MAG TPA: M48 family metalloprotease [Nitrospirota bacterium]|nr:M48 family metalloprotease [Nitrospirota bacterium]